ncbi:MAG: hypothetical protein N3A62_07100 [Thermodesulfovibrionales bacterium]|nr:hypothetical protein [Thermodesulfovibrionales bacterium]
MITKFLCIVISIFFVVLNCSFTFAEKVYTNEDLEKYKSKQEKQMTEEEKIKESERKQQYKHKEIEMEEKMWKNIQGGKQKRVTIEKE